MGMLRANVPAIYVYGGTILPGHYKGQDLNIVSVFEAVGQFSAGKMSEEDFCQIERRAIPGSGSCGGMYTANTMSSAFEALGMSLPYSSTMANVDDEIVAQRHALRAGAGRGGQERPEAARHRHAQVDRERRGRDHGHRRLDQRGAALPGHRACGRRRMDDRRLRARAPEGAGAVRPEAQRQVPGGRPAPRRRHPAGDEDAAERRPAARRLHDDHRPDDRRSAGGRARRAAQRPGRDPPDRQADVRRRPPGDPEGQPVARRLRGQDHRPEEPGDHRPGARVRRRAVGAGRHHGQADQGRRRDGAALPRSARAARACRRCWRRPAR